MEVLLTGPEEFVSVLRLGNVDLLLEADLDELHNGLLDEVVVDHLALAVLLYLGKNGGSQSVDMLLEYFVAVQGKGALGQRIAALVLHVVSFEVLK
jgi:hypothetical protein